MKTIIMSIICYTLGLCLAVTLMLGVLSEIQLFTRLFTKQVLGPQVTKKKDLCDDKDLSFMYMYKAVCK